MTRIRLQGVRVIEPERPGDAPQTVLLVDGQRRADDGQPVDETLAAEGLWLLPGAVDLCARLREPGATHKATVASEAAAALAAGITVLCLPPDTQPVIDSPAMLDRLRGLAAAVPALRLCVLGALTQGLQGEALAALSTLQAAGCVGVSNAQAPLASPVLARRALDYAHGLGLTVHVPVQDAHLAQRGCAHEGPVASRLGLPPIPVAAEVASLRFWITLVEDVGARVHFGRLSSARGVELVASAKARGLPVSADVAVHQLFLSEEDLEGFNALAHVLPPLRAGSDRSALREGLASGVIDAVCSDHQPHEADAKINPFPLTEPGLSGLDTLLPLMLDAVHAGWLSPGRLVESLSRAPARVLGLAPEHAGWVLVDPAARWVPGAADLRSRGLNNAFLGRPLQGRVRRVFPAGTAATGRV